ncbi:MAG TPA: efflux RND transporter periplasmic adaptor subunit, partial [Acidimicrobiales bacterium]|nr:efflux RND transporter periplasmic adaptor subunit [Acidimicrobiales bacterium]
MKWLNVALATGVIAAGATGVAAIGNPTTAKATVRTSPVQRGEVQATVTATGNVASQDTLALNFTSSGRVSEIDVKTGDHVTAGQVLAKLDDTTQRAALVSAQANLVAAQGRLDQVQHPLSAAQAAANRASADQAAASVANAQMALDDEQRMLAANATGYQAAVDNAQAQLNTDQAQQQSDQNRLQQDQSAGNSSAAASDQDKVNADNQAVTKDQAALNNAKAAQAQGLAHDQQSLDQAKASLVSAQKAQAVTIANNNLKAAPPLPGDLATDQAAVASAQASLTSAQQTEEGTTLTAPVDGTVGTVNGTVGQAVSGGGSSVASTTGSTSSSTGTASSASGSSSGSSSGFLALVDLGGLQVKAGFSETDASRLKDGQPATLSFNALPNEQVAGHIVAIDDLATVVSNVVTYNVTIALDNPTTDVKPGMSASVAVVVAKADNVLHVPTAALRGASTSGTVTVMRNGAQVPVPVAVGL